MCSLYAVSHEKWFFFSFFMSHIRCSKMFFSILFFDFITNKNFCSSHQVKSRLKYSVKYHWFYMKPSEKYQIYNYCENWYILWLISVCFTRSHNWTLKRVQIPNLRSVYSKRILFGLEANLTWFQSESRSNQDLTCLFWKRIS